MKHLMSLLLVIVVLSAVGFLAFRAVGEKFLRGLPGTARSTELKDNPDAPAQAEAQPAAADAAQAQSEEAQGPPPPLTDEEIDARAAAISAEAAPPAPGPSAKDLARLERQKQWEAVRQEKIAQAAVAANAAQQALEQAIAALKPAQDAVDEAGRKQAELKNINPRPADFFERSYEANKDYMDKSAALNKLKLDCDKATTNAALARSALEDLKSAGASNPDGKSFTVIDATGNPGTEGTGVDELGERMAKLRKQWAQQPVHQLHDHTVHVKKKAGEP